jgi:hypothetical protein
LRIDLRGIMPTALDGLSCAEIGGYRSAMATRRCRWQSFSASRPFRRRHRRRR